MELVHEEEKGRMQENKCRGVYIEKYTWGRSCLLKKSAYEIRMDKRMMRMKKEKKKKEKYRGKEKRKRHDEMLKVRIGGWKYKWRISTPLV